MLNKNIILKWGLLWLIAVCLIPGIVKAESYEERLENYKKIAEEVKFEFNYVDFDASLEVMQQVGASEWSTNEERIYDFLFRSEIKNYIELPENSGMDVWCHKKGIVQQEYGTFQFRSQRLVQRWGKC